MVVVNWYSSESLPAQSWRISSFFSCFDRREDRLYPCAGLLDKGNEPGLRLRLREAEELSRSNRISGRSVVRLPAVMPSPASTFDQIEIW